MCRTRLGSDIRLEMSEREGLVERRLRPHLLESRMGFFLALLVATILIFALSLKARAALSCVGRSLAEGASSCQGEAPRPPDPGVRIVFATEAVGEIPAR